MNINIFELLTYFIIYSFLGWIMESIVRTVCEKKLINTGFLYGPFCPIYGCGAIIMILFLKNFENTWILLFVTSFLFLTFWEYIVGVFLEKTFKTKYWDYSEQKFNFQGRICLVNSICWGILGIIFIKYIHPFVIEKLQYVDVISLKIVVYTAMILFIIDTTISIIKLVNIQSTLDKVESLNLQIKEKLLEVKNADKIKAPENVQILIDNMKLKRDRTLRRLYRHVYRLKRVFPAIDTKEIAEVLSKKVEDNKKIKEMKKSIRQEKRKEQKEKKE